MWPVPFEGVPFAALRVEAWPLIVLLLFVVVYIWLTEGDES
jgi:hypothetical protein